MLEWIVLIFLALFNVIAIASYQELELITSIKCEDDNDLLVPAANNFEFKSYHEYELAKKRIIIVHEIPILQEKIMDNITILIQSREDLIKFLSDQEFRQTNHISIKITEHIFNLTNEIWLLLNQFIYLKNLLIQYDHFTQDDRFYLCKIIQNLPQIKNLTLTNKENIILFKKIFRKY